MEPSYAREQNVNPINNGRIGIKILDTMESTIFWNSSNIPVINFALFHAAASPIIIENTSALITGMICGIESSNTISGSSFSPSTSVTIERCGISAYPAAVENNAAPTEDTYAIHTASRSNLDALFPIFVMDGAINPMMISGTQNEIICPRTYFKVTTMFRIAFVKPVPSFALRASPARIPITTPTRSLNGRLLKKLDFFIKRILQYYFSVLFHRCL